MKEAETLLVLAGNRQEFDSWARKWGEKLKNITVVNVDGPESILGWDSNHTFYMLMPLYQKRKHYQDALDQMRGSGYRPIGREAIESRLKKVTVQHELTDN